MDFGVSATKVEVSIARCNAVKSRLGFIVAHVAPILYQLVSLQPCHPIHGRTIALGVECRLPLPTSFRVRSLRRDHCSTGY
jgi:hypothetical protein